MREKPSRPKRKIKTLDDFAQAIQNDYRALGEQITNEIGAVKDEIGLLKSDMGGLNAAIKELRGDVTHIKEFMVSKADLEIAIRDEFGRSDHAKHIDDLRTRVDRIEKELGFKTSRRAA